MMHRPMLLLFFLSVDNLEIAKKDAYSTLVRDEVVPLEINK